MKVQHILLLLVISSCLLFLVSCSNTNSIRFYQKLSSSPLVKNAETLDIFAGRTGTMPEIPLVTEYEIDEAEYNEEEDISEYDDAITPTNSPLISPTLLIEILALLPAGSEFEPLYTKIGGKLGETIFSKLSIVQQSQIQQYLDIGTGTLLGEKIGQCFALNGFLLQEKKNLLTTVVENIALSNTEKAREQVIEKFLLDNNIVTKFGNFFADIIREMSKQITPYFAQKLTQCLLGPRPQNSIPPTSIKLDDLLNQLPTGNKYNKPYQLLGYIIGDSVGTSIINSDKHRFIGNTAKKASKWIGQSVGKCIAIYGWKLENKSNMLINLFTRLIKSKKVDNIITRQITSLINKYKLNNFGPEAVSLIQTIGHELSDYSANRLVQCLLLPMSQKNRDYKLIPIEELRKSDKSGSSTREAELDEFPIQEQVSQHIPSGSHHNHHHKTNVNVQVTV